MNLFNACFYCSSSSKGDFKWKKHSLLQQQPAEHGQVCTSSQSLSYMCSLDLD